MLIGVISSAVAVIIWVFNFAILLRQQRPAVIVLLINLSLFLVTGPLALIFLSHLLYKYGIADSSDRDVAFHIYVVSLGAVLIFGLFRMGAYNKRNRNALRFGPGSKP